MSDRAIGNIIRQSVRKETDKLNILCFSAHEGYESDLAKTPNTEFHAIWWNGLKKWEKKYRNIPSNYHIYDIQGDIKNIPNIPFDVILGHNTLAHGQQAAQLSRYLHVPLVMIEHCMPVIDQKTYEFYRNVPVDTRIFITEHSRNAWGYKPEECSIIHHGIDTEQFKPSDSVRENCVLSVANDFINRGQLLGFPIWQHIAKDVPCKVVGDTPGLSKPAINQNELLRHYQSNTIFLNTSTISPIPHSLLEAASCGCAIATTLTCAIPDFFVDGVNCVASNDPEELKQKTISLLSNPSEIKRLGEAARQLVLDKFNLDDFKNNWESTFRTVADMPYRR